MIIIRYKKKLTCHMLVKKLAWLFWLNIYIMDYHNNNETCLYGIPHQRHWDIKYTNCFITEKQLFLITLLRNECLFFWVHGEWIGARDKQIAWTAKRFSYDLFVPRSDSFPMNPEKKDTHSFYLQCFIKGPFIKFSDKRYKFKFPTATGT